MTSSFLDDDNQVVLLSAFETKEKAMEYYDLFLSDQNRLQGINDQGYASLRHHALTITPSSTRARTWTVIPPSSLENYLEGQ